VIKNPTAGGPARAPASSWPSESATSCRSSVSTGRRCRTDTPARTSTRSRRSPRTPVGRPRQWHHVIPHDDLDTARWALRTL